MTQVTHVTGYPERGVSQPALDRILVGVDFRQPSLAAARWAATHFGRRTQRALAHVQTVPEVPGFLQPTMPVLDDRLAAAVAHSPACVVSRRHSSPKTCQCMCASDIPSRV